ncbi:MAG: FHA domain-containing protein [Eikenella sp.]|nr:FHA domain-containing protein [Eikenella sp.]
MTALADCFRLRPAALCRAFLAAAFLTGLLSQPAAAEGEQRNPVVEAGESVYRLWGGVPVPPDMSAQILNPSILNEINGKGYVRLTNREGKILMLFKQGGTLYFFIGHGSGYLIADGGYLVTNDHVANMQEGAQIFVVESLAPKLSLLPAQTLASDNKKDLALLQATRLQGRPLPLADSRFVQPTLPVFSVGFPGASDDLMAGGGFDDPAGYLRPSIGEGTLKHTYKGHAGQDVWEHHAPISGGNSGGPLINRCGQVVGTNAAGHRQVQSTLLAVANSELLSLLQTRQVAPVQTQGECVDAAAAAATRQMQLLYGVMAVLLLAALGGAAYLWRLRGLVQAGRNPPINSQLIRKMVGAEAQRVAAAATSQAAGKSAHLAAQGGGAVDIVLPVGKAIVVGRSRDADVVLAAPEVSGRHVRLRYDGSELAVEDLGSRNGTFVNGRRVQNTRLQAGDVLRLGPDERSPAFKLQAAAAAAPVQLQPLAAGLPGIRLQPGQSVRVGRAADNDVCIRHPQVSGHHCRFSLDAEGRLWLDDSQSTNGTFVDHFERRIDRVQLQPGQTVYLASQEVAYQVSR